MSAYYDSELGGIDEMEVSNLIAFASVPLLLGTRFRPVVAMR